MNFKIAFAVLPSHTTKNWKILDDRDEIEDIVEHLEDVPHWYFEDDDDRKKKGARRCPSDPREYWCWRRCLSGEKKIELKDTCNADQATWLADCKVEKHSDSKSDSKNMGLLETIEEACGDGEDDDW